MTLIEKVQEVIVAVKDLKAATAEWEKLFGTKATDFNEHDGSKRSHFNLGNDCWLALAQPTNEWALGQFLKARGQGIYGVSMEVDDFSGILKRVKEQGGAAWEPEPGRGIIDSKVTNGVAIEIRSKNLPKFGGQPIFKRVHHLVVATNGTRAAAENWKKIFDPAAAPAQPGARFTGQITAGNTYFGLVDGEDHPAPVIKFLKEKGEGVYILSMVADDVLKTVRSARERGARIVGEEEGGGQLFIHPMSTHGVLLEVNDEAYSRNWTATYGKGPFPPAKTP